MTHEYLADPNSVSVQTIVSRIIVDTAHAGADLDEVAEYVKTAQKEKTDSSSFDSVEQWLGSAMNEVENIGHLAEALAKRLDPDSYSDEKNDTSEDNPLKAVKTMTPSFRMTPGGIF